MVLRIVPRISAKLRVSPRRRLAASFLWGLSVGAVAGVTLASALAQRLFFAHRAPHETGFDGAAARDQASAYGTSG